MGIMRRVVRRLASSSVLGLLCSCAPVTTSGGPEAPHLEAAVESPEHAAGQDVVTFLDRELRLGPFLDGCQYRHASDDVIISVADSHAVFDAAYGQGMNFSKTHTFAITGEPNAAVARAASAATS